MSGQYIINFTDPIKPPFTINSLETEGPGSINTIPIVTANGGGGGNFAVSGDFTPRFIPGFAFNVVGSLVAPPNDGAYVVSTSVFQGTSNIDAISAVQKKFVLNGFDYTAVFTPGRIFKIANSQTPVSNNGYWIVASSAFVAGNTEIIVAVGVPSGYRDGTTIDGSGSAATPIVSAQAAPTNKFTVTGNQTAYFTPAFGFTVSGTPSNNGAYTVLSSTYNVVLNQTIITVTTPVPANQGAVGTISFTLVTGTISTNLTVVLPTTAVPTSVNFPDGDINYTLVGNTSLTLPGRGVVNYGLNIIEDLVHMLENFYNPTPPVNPTKGQLWYDSVGNTLKVFNNGSVFAPITGGGGSAAISSLTVATSPNTIDNTDFQQTWTWELTTDPDFGLLFDETAPSTGGFGDQALLAVNTQLGSSASPLSIWRGGYGAGTLMFGMYPSNPGVDGADVYLKTTQAEAGAGNGGSIFMFAQGNFAGGTGSNGVVFINAGTGSNVGTDVDGGFVEILGGAASSAGAGSGGDIQLIGGAGRGSNYNGGVILMQGGTGLGNAQGGDIRLIAGGVDAAEGGVIALFGGQYLNPTSLGIQTVSTGLHGMFTVVGDKVAKFYPGFTFTVSGSTGNNGSYTVLSTTLFAGLIYTTGITVTGTISNATADGVITGAFGGHIILMAGNATGNNDAPVVNIFGGNATSLGGAGGKKGGNIHLKAGDSAGTTGASQGGDVVITAGQNANNPDQGFFTIITGTPPTNRLTINGNGAWFLNGLAGNPGDVFTSNGNFIPPTWNPASSGSQPANQIVYGTGGGVTSEAEFTWEPTTNTLSLGSTITPATIRAPDDGAATPGTLTILGGSTPSANNGGDINITAGDAGNFNNGGGVNITSGTSALGNGGTVIIAGANAPSQGGTVQINGGSGGFAFAGNVSITGGSASGGVTGGGGVNIVGGTGAGGVIGGPIAINAGNGGGVDAPGGGTTIVSGNATGTGLGGFVYISPGTSVTGTYGNVQIATNAGFIENISTGFGAAGDSKSDQYMVSVETTDATTTELFLDSTGGTRRMTLSANSAWRFEIHLTAYETVGTNVGWVAAYEVKGAIKNVAGTTSIVGSVSSNITADDSSGAWSITVDADNGNSALRVQVTGEAATTIRWVAFARTVEVSA